MGFFSFLAGLQDVACATITFRETGNHQITVEREPAAPPWLDGPVLPAVLFLHYTAKALHALGPSADQLRRHLALSALVLRRDTFEPFASGIDSAGQCIGHLRMNRSGALSATTRFHVPIADTNNYIVDSVLLLVGHAVEAQPRADDRRRLGEAIQTLEQFYAVSGSASLRALREAPAAAVAHYRPETPPA